MPIRKPDVAFIALHAGPQVDTQSQFQVQVRSPGIMDSEVNQFTEVGHALICVVSV